MAAARRCGLTVPQSFVIPGTTPLYCIERYDRIIPDNPRILDGLAIPKRLHQEDLCQAFGVPSGGNFKYQEADWGGLSGVTEFLRDRSIDPATDIIDLLRLMLFNYLIGNCDGHLKNLSIMRNNDWAEVSLAPGYDLLNTTCYERILDREMAMKIGARRDIDHIIDHDFILMARELGLGFGLVIREAHNIAEKFENAFGEACAEAHENGITQVLTVRDEILRDSKHRLQLLSNLKKG
jgi:serine/threonine-protein kinase HipA